MPSILIADDNTNIQKMVALAFEDRGIEVVSVGNGEAAVRRIPELNPDLVLADIFMPVRNGYEVCEFVKKDQRFAHVPVILLAGAFDPIDEKEARRVGADGVLKKPFVPPDPLIAMVISALEKNPRVIAELARTKATLEPHALAEPPGPAQDGAPFQAPMPPKLEVKPLPEFPEPSPEEAALVYGLGKGRRTLDREDLAGLSEPAPPVAPENEADEEPFEGASTTSDWRRDRMKFELPAEAVNQPAVPEEAFEPAAVLLKEDPPSVRKTATAHEPERKPEPAVQQTVAEPSPRIVPAASAWEAFTKQIKQIPTLVIPKSTPPEAALASSPTKALEATAREAEPAVATIVTPPPSVPEPVTKVAPASVPELVPQPEPVLAPTATHWMDALGSFSGSQQSAGGWMDSLSGQSSGTHTAVQEPTVATSVSVIEDGATSASSPATDEFFASEPQQAEAPSTPAADGAAQPPSSAPSFEPLDAPSEDRPLLRDPNLVEPPAVRVTPEPLLIDEASSEPSTSYGQKPEELTPLHSFTVPEPVAAEPPAEEPALAETPQPEFDERIPTGPPPNKEALAGIPFLNPPPGFDPNAPAEKTPSTEAVDVAVERVLERLEPQLHDLFARGVLKPLIETLLQQELAKKEK